MLFCTLRENFISFGGGKWFRLLWCWYSWLCAQCAGMLVDGGGNLVQQWHHRVKILPFPARLLGCWAGWIMFCCVATGCWKAEWIHAEGSSSSRCRKAWAHQRLWKGNGTYAEGSRPVSSPAGTVRGGFTTLSFARCQVPGLNLKSW